MCLLKVDRAYDGTSEAIRTGYKVFENYNGMLTSFIVPVGKTLPEGVWLDEKDYRPVDLVGKCEVETVNEDRTYPVGWHVFLNEDDAKLFALLAYEDEYVVIRKVQCRGLLVSGIGGSGRKVAVYKYIKISKDVVWMTLQKEG